MKQDAYFCQQKIEACQQLMSSLIIMEALYKGFPFPSMNRALSDVRNLLRHQQIKLTDIHGQAELHNLSQSRTYTATAGQLR